MNAWEIVQMVRSPGRPTALDYIDNIFDEFIELHGDRNFSDDKAIVCGLGSIEGKAFTVIAQQKGRNTKENIERNFGMPNPESYRKALRFMKQAEKFKRPIATFIDTKGAYPGIEAEERGQGEAIARNLLEMSRMKTPIISVVIGEGSSRRRTPELVWQTKYLCLKTQFIRYFLQKGTQVFFGKIQVEQRKRQES